MNWKRNTGNPTADTVDGFVVVFPTEAAARIAIAAPTMLKALELVLQYGTQVSNQRSEFYQDILPAVRAAIQEAL